MSKKLMMLIILIVVLMLGMIGGGFYLMLSKVASLENRVPATEEEAVEEPEIPEQDVIRETHSMETMIVNLADEGGTRYLRITMDLELADEGAAKELEQRMPQVKNSLLMVLPAKYVKDLNTFDGKISLRDALIAQINELFKREAVTNIYFTEFVIQ